MKILLVDDEILILEKLRAAVAAVVPDAQLFPFFKAREAMEFVRENPVDVAFLDINMRVISGIDLAKQMQELYPKLNIIFCTGYAEYALDAHGLHCSGYILKPATEAKVADAMSNLRFPIEAEEPAKRVRFICFGNFDALVDGQPIRFKYEKTRELLAYLVDRCGASCNAAEIAANLWDDDNHMNYLKSIRRDLIMTLEEHGCADILSTNRGHLAILPEMVSCDYYDWRNGEREKVSYFGEYMSQYSWAEYTNAYLEQNAEMAH